MKGGENMISQFVHMFTHDIRPLLLLLSFPVMFAVIVVLIKKIRNRLKGRR